MVSTVIPVDAFDLVIFGATGDLVAAQDPAEPVPPAGRAPDARGRRG